MCLAKIIFTEKSGSRPAGFEPAALYNFRRSPAPIWTLDGTCIKHSFASMRSQGGF